MYHYQKLYLKNTRVYNFESDLLLDVDSQIRFDSDSRWDLPDMIRSKSSNWGLSNCEVRIRHDKRCCGLRVYACMYIRIVHKCHASPLRCRRLCIENVRWRMTIRLRLDSARLSSFDSRLQHAGHLHGKLKC